MTPPAHEAPMIDEQVLALASAFDAAHVAYAFGGAIALAYWATPRGTEDIDVNVFVDASRASRIAALLESLGVSVERAPGDDISRPLAAVWGHTPLHLFFAHDPFHVRCAERRRRVPFAGGEIEVLAPEDIAIFKIVYDRPRDRAEVRELLLCMGEQFDRAHALHWLDRLLGPGDARVERFREAASELLGPPPVG